MGGFGTGGFGTGPFGSGSGSGEVFDPGDGVAVPQTDELELQTSHTAKGLDLLIEQFKKKMKNKLKYLLLGAVFLIDYMYFEGE